MELTRGFKCFCDNNVLLFIFILFYFHVVFVLHFSFVVTILIIVLKRNRKLAYGYKVRRQLIISFWNPFSPYTQIYVSYQRTPQNNRLAARTLLYIHFESFLGVCLLYKL